MPHHNAAGRDEPLITYSAMTERELEDLALRQRADTGIVLYRLWAALTPESRLRIGRITQDAARLILGPPVRTRASTPRMDDVALEDLLTRCGAG